MSDTAYLLERRAQRLLDDVRRLDVKLLVARPDPASIEWFTVEAEVDDLGKRFRQLADDVRRSSAQIDHRQAGLSRYVRGPEAYRERQSVNDRQKRFAVVQGYIHEVRSALKLLVDRLFTPSGANIVSDLQEIIHQSVEQIVKATAKATTTVKDSGPVITAAHRPGFDVAAGADVLLVFAIVLTAIYDRLKKVRGDATGSTAPGAGKLR